MIKMRTTKFVICILALTLTTPEVADAQIGYSSRNWFGLALRNIPIKPLSERCLPDDSPCERLTDCCTNWCRPGYPVPRCEPSPCGCPQPPWTPEPIAEVCSSYGQWCNGDHHTCCTGYCRLMYPHRKCWRGPCLDCE